ncbi:hypothetical protein SAMN05421690_103118 [Nitrosomonas sp. Nm51]|nr:hypothetical protein SAMN05421690_103118 [Nitrosomonas sp. Nm51]
MVCRLECSTDDTTVDCIHSAVELIIGINADYLPADRAYDINGILEHCKVKQIEPVIPSKKNRTQSHDHDKNLYQY